MTQTKTDAKAWIESVQRLLDELRTLPNYARYVEEHKLGLIDDRLSKLDKLLDAGVVH